MPRNMSAILGIQPRRPQPTRAPMPMMGGPIQAPPRRAAPPMAQPLRKAATGDTADPESGKVSPEDVDYSDNDLCETCANMGSDGNCTKYNFPVDKTGHCEAGYEPSGGGGAEETGESGAGADEGGGEVAP